MLVFSLRRHESFYVVDQKVQLIDFNDQGAVLKTQDKTFNCPNFLVPLPGNSDVRVSSGKRQDVAIRIGIEAPMNIKILRERLYHVDRKYKDPPRRREPRVIHQRAVTCRTCQGTMKVQQGNLMVPCPAAQNPALPICDKGGFDDSP